MISKKEAKQLREKELKKRWKKKYRSQTLAKLPKDFSDDYKTYKYTPIKNIESMYIHGETGFGKTILACFIFLDVVKKLYLKKGYYPHIKSLFINFPEFLVELQKQIGSPTYYNKIAELMECDILVLDDLDARRPTDWMIDIVYNAINHRQKNKMLTIITSNNNLQKLAEVFGDDRIIRRIDQSFKVVNKQHYSKSAKQSENKGK